MNAIEFETDATDGVIRIPNRHKKLFSRHLKVILLSEIKTDQRTGADEIARKACLLFSTSQLRSGR